jgi:hypothetical protein
MNALDILIGEEETVKMRAATAPLATTPLPTTPPKYYLFVAYGVEDAPLIVFNGWLRGIGCHRYQVSEEQDNSEFRWLVLDHLKALGIPVPILTEAELDATFSALEEVQR